MTAEDSQNATRSTWNEMTRWRGGSTRLRKGGTASRLAFFRDQELDRWYGQWKLCLWTATFSGGTSRGPANQWWMLLAQVASAGSLPGRTVLVFLLNDSSPLILLSQGDTFSEIGDWSKCPFCTPSHWGKLWFNLVMFIMCECGHQDWVQVSKLRRAQGWVPSSILH